MPLPSRKICANDCVAVWRSDRMPSPGHSVAVVPSLRRKPKPYFRSCVPPGLEERARVDVGRVLRTQIQALAERAVRRAGDEIAAGVRAHAAFGRQHEARVVVRVLSRHEHVRADDAIVGDFHRPCGLPLV